MRFHQECRNFLIDGIGRGYTERVPQHLVTCFEGKVWCVLHHGVDHPRKGNLCVTFNCGVKYKGTSRSNMAVNLQGPTLSSSFPGVLTSNRQEPVTIMADVQAMFHQVEISQNGSATSVEC